MNNYDLKQEIKKLGMTQKAFAEYIGVGEQTVGQWVRGVVPTPKWTRILIRLLEQEKRLKEAKSTLLEAIELLPSEDGT